MKKRICQRLLVFLSLITLLISSVNSTFCFIVTKTESSVNTFVPLDKLVGKLLINKTVEHPFGDSYVIPDTVSFDFVLNFGSFYANTTLKTTNGKVVTDENGAVTVSVKPNSSFTIEDIDPGTNVTITELLKDGSGFVVKDGIVTKQATAAEDGSLTFHFVNVYTPAAVNPTNVTVGGVKLLEGRDWQDGDTFTFALEQQTGENEWTAIGTKTVTYQPTVADFNRFAFDDLLHGLSFDKIGTYSFRITEAIGALENMTYDPTVYTFALSVTDADMDGKLEVGSVTADQTTVEEENGVYAIFATFQNTFTPKPDDLVLDVDVKTTVEHTTDREFDLSEFEFILENVETGDKRIFRTDDDGHITFDLPFDEDDIGKTFVYDLYQKINNIPGVVYDERVYRITITISLDDDNKLKATITVDGKLTNDIWAVFENRYAELPVSPPTGDHTTVLWFVAMALSGTVCTFLIAYSRKKRTNK
ncbi:MAG: hypothetical protein IJO59_01050 [Clostridia bacterium]|nr:hypothetical protein [Clostridia bacterium]